MFPRCGFARHILENHQTARVFMADIGAQDNPIVGYHNKNSVKLVHHLPLACLGT